MNLKTLADQYRENERPDLKGGVVVIFDNEVSGWMDELRDPQGWEPGCFAVDEDGNVWVSVGGNAYDGAESWQPVHDERPIIFSTDSVESILDGRKIMTRRVIKPQPIWVGDPYVPFKTQDADPKGIIDCPYGKPGDLLWVRETWRPEQDGEISFKADFSCDGPWKPSIHMPKKCARIWLKVTGVRVERLQDISELDAGKEGIYCAEPGECFVEFICLWDKKAKRGYGWYQNPWVWVVEFERVDRPQAAKEK